MNNTLPGGAKIVVYGTCLFLLPFWFQAYFTPLASLNIDSIGLLPSETAELVGLSNIRGTVGGLRLAIISLAFIGAFYKRPDLLLAAAITVGVVALGRFISLAIDGWELISFVTAAGEVVIVLSMLHLRRNISRPAIE
jgi:hypothetical protein